MLTDNSTLDYATLRQEGLRLLERLAGPEWTDFNEHDPGITILEQYCYALSELAYRCNFSIPDLLSSGGTNPYASLHKPSDILTSQPVTLTDLRKLAIDVEGVNNAWIEKIDQAEPKVFYDRHGLLAPLDKQKKPMASEGGEGTGPDDPKKFIQLKGGDGLEPVNLKGLYRVLIEQRLEPNTNRADISAKVKEKLLAHRPLCMDFVSVEVMKAQKIRLKANIEIGPLGNAVGILAAIHHKLNTFIAPPVPFHTLAERLAAGLHIDEIFDGPSLEHGFIDTEELQCRVRKTAVRVSDLIHEIMDVEGVLMVKQLSLSMDDVHWENWWLDLDKTETPVWDWSKSILRLERRQIEIVARNTSPPPSQTRLVLPTPKPEDLEIKAPAGRDRRVGQYYSAQHLFPALYGLGDKGLPSDSDAQRRAQVKQLKAYLLFFDQLLANEFAQLAHVGDLLGFAENPQQTYFSQWVDEPSLGLDTVWRDPKDLAKRLERMVEKPAKAPDPNQPIDIDWLRKHRFLDHLLARFAEHFTDYAQFIKPGTDLAKLARDKQDWLSQYPKLSAGRGTGYDILSCNILEDSGLEQRLRIKLGLADFYMVEHVLLRPIDADNGQQPAPLLADARCADPYSLQISFVFPKELEENNNFCRFVEQTVREETPAHLTVYLCWLDKGDRDMFWSAYKTWVVNQRKVRLNNREAAFHLRDARDRLIDLLGIGRTYPLVDLPVNYTDKVAVEEKGTVTLPFSQQGVTYELHYKDGKTALDEKEGNGDKLELITPPIKSDINFKVRANNKSKKFVLDLRAEILIKEGLNLDLQALLRKGNPDDPELGDPPTVDHGKQVEVLIKSSQSGVEYRLVREVANKGDFKTENPPINWEVIPTEPDYVVGKKGDVTLKTRNIDKDTLIRILATKQYQSNHQSIHQDNKQAKEPLKAKLPLRVKAEKSLTIEPESQLVGYKENVKLQIKKSQVCVSYQLLTRSILDNEFVREFKQPPPLLKTPNNDLWVRSPLNPTPDVKPIGKEVSGNGGDITLEIPQGILEEDSYIVVEATKTHTIQGVEANTSKVQLNQAIAILVKPATDCSLRLKAKNVTTPNAGLTKTVYIVIGGQPGVFYHFRVNDTPPRDLGLKVYFHKQGKGIQGLQVEIDFVVAGNLPTPLTEWDRLPEWHCPEDVAAEATLSILAVKAQTVAKTEFTRTVSQLLSPP